MALLYASLVDPEIHTIHINCSNSIPTNVTGYNDNYISGIDQTWKRYFFYCRHDTNVQNKVPLDVIFVHIQAHWARDHICYRLFMWCILAANHFARNPRLPLMHFWHTVTSSGQFHIITETLVSFWNIFRHHLCQVLLEMTENFQDSQWRKILQMTFFCFSDVKVIIILLNRLYRHRSKKTSKLCVTGLCEGKSPVTGEFPAQRPVTRKMFPFDDVIMR